MTARLSVEFKARASKREARPALECGKGALGFDKSNSAQNTLKIFGQSSKAQFEKWAQPLGGLNFQRTFFIDSTFPGNVRDGPQGVYKTPKHVVNRCF